MSAALIDSLELLKEKIYMAILLQKTFMGLGLRALYGKVQKQIWRMSHSYVNAC